MRNKSIYQTCYWSTEVLKPLSGCARLLLFADNGPDRSARYPSAYNILHVSLTLYSPVVLPLLKIYLFIVLIPASPPGSGIWFHRTLSGWELREYSARTGNDGGVNQWWSGLITPISFLLNPPPPSLPTTHTPQTPSTHVLSDSWWLSASSVKG